MTEVDPRHRNVGGLWKVDLIVTINFRIEFRRNIPVMLNCSTKHQLSNVTITVFLAKALLSNQSASEFGPPAKREKTADELLQNRQLLNNLALICLQY